MRVLCVFFALVFACSVAACGVEGVDGGNGATGGSGGSGGDPGAVTDGGGDSGNAGSGSESGGGDSGSGGDSGDNAGSGGSENGGGGDSGSGSGGGSGGDSGTGGGDSGSGGGSTDGAGLSGTASEVLGKLVEDLISAGVEMPMSLPGPPPEVTAELSQNTIGLSEGDFDRLVASAAHSLAAIGTFAHQLIIIQGKDASAAAEIKGLVSGPGGYDPQKWICVWPERAMAVDAGAYVLVAASYVKVVEAAERAFRDAAGKTGEAVIFWEHSVAE